MCSQECRQAHTGCVAPASAPPSSSPVPPLADSVQPTTSEPAAAPESLSPPAWLKDARCAVGEIVGNVLSVELEEAERRSPGEATGLGLVGEQSASMARLADLAMRLAMLAHPETNAAVRSAGLFFSCTDDMRARIEHQEDVRI